MLSEPRLIEGRFPCREVGAETQRERGASSALPPLYFLHVWWARRPLTPSRAAVLGSILPAGTDDDVFLRELGIVKKQAVIGNHRWTLVGKNLKLVENYEGKEIIPYSVAFHKALDMECERRKTIREKLTRLMQENEAFANNPVLLRWYDDNAEISSIDSMALFSNSSFVDVVTVSASPAETNERIAISEADETVKILGDKLKIDPEDLYAYGRAYESEIISDHPDVTVFDPTAGGGSIPFEAMRLGCKVIANDLNPVATVIEKATLQYPFEYGIELLPVLENYGNDLCNIVRDKMTAYYHIPPTEIDQTGLLFCRTVICPHCKEQYLLEVLDDRIKQDGRLAQTVLFTRFLDSLHSIRKYLRSRNPNLRVGIYAGQEAIYFNPSSLKDVSTSHEEIKRLFRNGEIDLLLCTDAAAEGLNLQSADLLINFDLGWNPMKIEQRIGRIDRIGQKYNEIFVMNMCYLGSTEEIVYGRLWSRLQEAGLVVGTQQISLLPVEADDFRKLQEGKMTEEQLEKKAKEKIQEQRRINQSLEISAQDQYSMYRKLSQAAKNEPLPANLDSVWDALERASFMESAVMDNEHHKWRSDGTDQYPDLCGTTDRSEITEDMPLLTWGNKRFDSFLTTMSDMLDEEYPGCVRRVVASHGSVVRVAWLAVNKQGGIVEINRYSDLKDLEIDTHASITDEQVAAYSAGMTSVQTGKNIAAMDSILDRNNDYAEAQSWLVSYIATQLLKEQAASGNTGANNAIKALDEARGQKGKRIQMPWKANEYIEGKYLFPTNYLGNQVFMPIGELLYDCAVKRCCRAMSAIHKKKSTITVDELLQNIRRSSH